MKYILSLLLSFILTGCHSSSKELYTVHSILSSREGGTEYLMISEEGQKLIIRKNNAFPWEIGKKIYLEGDLAK